MGFPTFCLWDSEHEKSQSSSRYRSKHEALFFISGFRPFNLFWVHIHLVRGLPLCVYPVGRWLTSTSRTYLSSSLPCVFYSQLYYLPLHLNPSLYLFPSYILFKIWPCKMMPPITVSNFTSIAWMWLFSYRPINHSRRATHRLLYSNSLPRKAFLSLPNHRILRTWLWVTFGCSLLCKWASRKRVSQP
jgi:hypothetical protein